MIKFPQKQIFTTLLFSLLIGHFNAQIVYVDIDANGSNDGSSWTNAYNAFQDALDVAQNGDEIWMAEGLYHPTTSLDREIKFQILSGVQIYGGFNGSESNVNDRNWRLHPTILSGEIGSSSETDNSKDILEINNLTAEVVIDGLIFEDFYRDTPGAHCVVYDSHSIKYQHVIFRNLYNTGTYTCYSINTDAEYTDCLFHDNYTAFANIYFSDNTNSNSVGIISNCTVTRCESSVPVRKGNGTSELYVYNSIFYDNIDAMVVGDPANITEAHNTFYEEGTTEISSFSNISIVDPIFTDPNNNNFTLSSTSPAIDYGNNSYVNSSYDLGLNNRIQDSAIDAGAYEFTAPDVIYIDEDAAGSNNGSSWSNAYTSLESAVESEGSFKEYWVADGTYFVTSDGSETTPLFIPDNISIYGGFGGTESSLSERNLGTNKTIISGDIGSSTSIDNSEILFKMDDNSTGVLFDGLIFEKAYKSVGLSQGDKGAIHAENSSLTILNCIFRENAAYTGAALWIKDCSLYMENCLIHENNSSAGQMITSTFGASDIDLVNVTITDNIIPASNFVLGALTGSNVNIYNSIIWEGTGHPLVNSLALSNVHNCILETGTANLDTFSNIRSEDPLFVDPSNDDYGITAGSNAYDSGNPVYSTQSHDLNGDNRIIDTAIDRGAYESSICIQPNDFCNNAIPLIIDDVATFGSNRCATHTIDEVSSCFVNNGHSVWYSFEAPANGSVEVVSTWVSKFTNTFNIRHVIYGGNCLTPIQLECDNEGPVAGGETTLVSGLTPGETYFIKVDGFNTQEGRFTIAVNSAEIPPVFGVTYVDADASGLNDGSSWSNAYTDLMDALTNDENGEIIWVAEGNYFPSNTNDILNRFVIDKEIKLYGGFTGLETDQSQRELSSSHTILDGNIGSPTDNTDNSANIMFVTSDVTEEIIIDGFTFQNAYWPYSDGYNLPTPLVLSGNSRVTNCIFKNNFMHTFSGILGIGDFGNPGAVNFYIENCLFYDNRSQFTVVSTQQDGAMFISNCTFTKNIMDIPGNVGVVLGSPNVNLNVYNSIFWENSPANSFVHVSSGYNCISESGPIGLTNFQNISNCDPYFVDSNNHDYSLGFNSSALGHGNNQYSNSNVDLNGNTRIQETTIDAGCFESPYIAIYGCKDPLACNYVSNSTTDDGSCVYPGCTQSQACNFSPLAGCDDGSCLFPGCNDSIACNYDPSAGCDDSSCDYSSCNSCEGDANLDGTVNVIDLVAVSSNFGCTVNCLEGDANLDGMVNILDLVSVSSNFGSNCP